MANNEISKIKVPVQGGYGEFIIKDTVARDNASAASTAAGNAKDRADAAYALAQAAVGGVNTTPLANYEALVALQNPSANVIYLVGDGTGSPDAYDEYMHINGNWEKIGNTAVDLTDYAKSEDLDDYLKSEDLTTELGGYQVTGSISNTGIAITPTKEAIYSNAGTAGSAASFVASTDENDSEMLVLSFTANTPTVLPTLSTSEFLTGATAKHSKTPTFTGAITKKTT